jgi:hypothetical protein
MTDKFTKEFNEYNALMKRLGSKTKTLEQYKLYRAGKLRRGRGKPAPKSLLETTTYRRQTPNYPSGDDLGQIIPKKQEMQYTGDKLMGIATMHKSNMVPVFKQEDAIEIARMRRG